MPMQRTGGYSEEETATQLLSSFNCSFDGPSILEHSKIHQTLGSCLSLFRLGYNTTQLSILCQFKFIILHLNFTSYYMGKIVWSSKFAL